MTDDNWTLLIRAVEACVFTYLTIMARKNQAVTERANTAAATAADQAAAAVRLGDINAAKLDQIHVAVNSRITQLLDAVSQQQHAEGVIKGTEDERKRLMPIERIVGPTPVVIVPPEPTS